MCFVAAGDAHLWVDIVPPEISVNLSASNRSLKPLTFPQKS